MTNTKQIFAVLNSLQEALKTKMHGSVLSLQHLSFVDFIDLLADSDVRFTNKNAKPDTGTILITEDYTEDEKKLDLRGLSDCIDSNKETNIKNVKQLTLHDIIGGKEEDAKRTGD